MPRPILYTLEESPPCRAVLITARAIGLELEIREISLLDKEHMRPEFIKMNPQHTVPTLDDNGFILWDSHAIMRYLVAKYSKNDSLYPKDLQMQVKVNQVFHFDTGYLFGTLRIIARPMYLEGKSNISEEKIDILNNAFEIFEKFLVGKKWVVGNSYTLADISCATTLSSLTIYRKLDKYPNIQAWLKNCEKNLPGYEELNTPGNQKLFKIMKQISPNYV